MAEHDIPFGIYTDHSAFQFVRMDASTGSVPKKVLHHSDLFGLMQGNYKSFNPQAPAVYAHLFEIMGVPRSTNLLAKAAESAATWAQRAEYMNSREE